MHSLGQVCSPQVLEVVIVGGRPTPLDLRDDAATFVEGQVEVGAWSAGKTQLPIDHPLLDETQFVTQQ